MKQEGKRGVRLKPELLALTYFLHFGGSIENPFVYYFIFHMVIAGILLSNRAAYAHGAFAVLLIGSTSFLEYAGVIPHYHVSGFPDSEMIYNFKYLAGSLGVLSSTLFITIFMAATIVNKLRDREEKLDAANKLLAEQDRLKSQYVLTVSHDLKSSVSTIQSCLKVVLKGLTGSIGQKTTEMLSRAERRSVYMLDFISDLLNLSSIRADKNLRKSQVSVSRIAERTVDNFSQRFPPTLIHKRRIHIQSNIGIAPHYCNYRIVGKILSALVKNSQYFLCRYRHNTGCSPLEIVKITCRRIALAINRTGHASGRRVVSC